MQRTRLNSLFEDVSRQFSRWLLNPWRKTSLIVISLLFGYFFGVSIAAVAGQAADQDIVVSGILVIGAELVSRLAYGVRWRERAAADRSYPLWIESLNSFKIGAMYALCVEAFKLGS